MSDKRIGWNQPLCASCFAAWKLGCGHAPIEPARATGVGDPCLVCGTPTTIYARIDPALAGYFQNAKLCDYD